MPQIVGAASRQHLFYPEQHCRQAMVGKVSAYKGIRFCGQHEDHALCNALLLVSLFVGASGSTSM